MLLAEEGIALAQRVGRLTLAATLILLGAVLIVDNLTGWRAAWYVTRLWPVMLILFGLEWVWVSGRAKSDARVRSDGGAIVVLIFLGFGSAIWGSASSRQFYPPLINIEPTIHLVPPGQPIFSVPVIEINPFAVRSEELKLTQSLDPVDIADLKEITVDERSAAITVVHGGPSLEVEALVTAYGRTREEALANAGQIRLRVDQGPVTRIYAQGADTQARYDLAYRISVPDGVGLQLRSLSGAIRVTDAPATVSAETTSGSITVSGAGGDVKVSSTSGAIDLTQVGGAVKAVATSGGIRAADAGGPVVATTSSGGLNVQAARIQGAYDLSASSGSILMQIPAGAGVTVSARSSSGTVSGPPWLTIGEGRNSGAGTSGAGRYTITARTSSGAIRIDDH